MKLIAAVSILAVGCHAACFGAARLEGETEMSALCTDDVTGFQFEYIDIGNVLENDSTATNDLSSRMYAAYLSGIGNATVVPGETALVDRSVSKIYWNKCVPEQVAGVCSSDHVINWNGGLDSFSSSLHAVMAHTQQNDRTYHAPRSICSKFSKGTICVSWAAYYHAELQTAQVNDIVSGCTYTCEQEYDSCLARAMTGSKDEYYCVSNRAKGCSADTSIRPCD